MQKSELFERVLKEADTPALYFRDDPNSEEAKRCPELGEDVDVGASLTEKGNTYNFVWRRFKSNLNLANHGFTHYLTRFAYADEKRVVEGQKIGNEVVDLNTDYGNIGLLCSMPVEVLNGVKIDDCYNKEEDFPLSVLLLVRQEKSSNDRIRLITCFPTDVQKYLRWYARRYYSRQRVRSDELGKRDIEVGAQSYDKLSEHDIFKEYRA